MKRWLIGLSSLCLLAACSDGDHEELREWMRESTKDLRGNVPKLPQVTPYQSVPYDAESLPDPFNPTKIEPETRRPTSGKGNGGGLAPDFDAREQRNNLLEKFPLENLRMVGFLKLNEIPIAVIQAEQHVKQVKVGDYIGLDFGMVIKITETELVVRELIQDSAGDWSERSSSLYLKTSEGGRK